MRNDVVSDGGSRDPAAVWSAIRRRIPRKTGHTGAHVGVAAYSQLENEMTESFDSESAQWIFRRRHLHVIHRPVDQQVAVKAVCQGIERRSRRIAAPAKTRYARWAGMALQFALVRWVPDIRPAAQIWASDQRLQGRVVELRLPGLDK